MRERGQRCSGNSIAEQALQRPAGCTHAVSRSDDSLRITFTPPRMALPTLQYDDPKSRPTTASRGSKGWGRR